MSAVKDCRVLEIAPNGVDDVPQPDQRISDPTVFIVQGLDDLRAHRSEEGDRALMRSTPGRGEVDPVRAPIAGVRFAGDVPCLLYTSPSPRD